MATKHIFFAATLCVLTACGSPAFPRQTDDAAIIAYRSTVNTSVRQLIDARADMQTHFTQYYTSTDARERIERDMQTIQQAHTTLEALTPPPSRSAIHVRVLDATAACSASIDAYREAFHTNNATNTAPQAAQLDDQCVQKLGALNRDEIDA